MNGFKTIDVSYEIYWLKNAFPKTIINENMEVIVEPKANEYFLTADCYTKEDIQCKVLEWFSRGRAKQNLFKVKEKIKSFVNICKTELTIILEWILHKRNLKKSINIWGIELITTKQSNLSIQGLIWEFLKVR